MPSSMESPLMAGSAEVDITPPVGVLMAGNLKGRPSTGVDDPLHVKAVVLESGGERLVCVTYDLVGLPREEGDRCLVEAARKSGLPAERIVWAATHTHTGPYTSQWQPPRSAPQAPWPSPTPPSSANSA